MNDYDMNNFGELLYSLRKKKGLTQAQLADLLGVTNKAVSKWETGEAMPETSLLLPLSKIFGITIDELLNGKLSDQPDKSNEQKIGDHLFTRGKDNGPETLLDKICGVVCAAVALIGIAAYVLVVALTGLWHPYWIIIPTCCLGCGLIGIIFNLCDGNKRNKSFAKGKNPYTDGVCGIIVLTSIIAYLFIGALKNLWHPYWIIIIVGVAVGGIIAAVGNCIASKK